MKSKAALGTTKRYHVVIGAELLPVHKTGNLAEVRLGEASGSQGRCSHPEAARHQSRFVSGDSVLVGCNVGELQHALHPAAVNALAPQVNQHQVVLSACSKIDKSKQGSRWKIGRTKAANEMLSKSKPL